MNFEKLIQREAKEISLLRQNIHRTFRSRTKNRGAWIRACEEFHNYDSEMDTYIEQIYGNSKINDIEVLEFGLKFLELDPVFFRSGYIKEEILTKIKRSTLTKDQVDRLKSILFDSVERRGSKEFKYYCRLAGFISDERFVKQLESIENIVEGKGKYRAKRMLNTIVDSQSHNKVSKKADGGAAA